MNALKGSRILLTGIAGLLGAHVARRLLDAGASVTGLLCERRPDDLFHSSGLIHDVSLVEGRVEDASQMTNAVSEQGIAAIVHLAAQTQVLDAVANPWTTWESNVRGTYSILEAARGAPGMKAVLVASSDKAYGPAPVLPYTEEMPLSALAPYDASKAAADRIAQSYAATYGMPVVVTRCANLFGPGDFNWDRLIPGALRAWLRDEPFQLRSDGSPRRDYLYVEDAAEAVVTLLARRMDGTLGHAAYNIGSGQPRSVREVVDDLRALTAQRLGRAIPDPLVRGDARHEIDAQWLSSTRIQSETGWRPRTEWHDALARTLEWYAGHFGVKG